MTNPLSNRINLDAFGEVLYQTHDHSRKHKAVYKLFGDCCVYVDVELGSPINFGAQISRLIADKEKRRWPGDLRVFCLEPMVRGQDVHAERREQFEFVEIIYDPDDHNYHCDYVHTGCPKFIRDAFSQYLKGRTVQTFQYISTGNRRGIQDWSTVMRA